MRTLAAEAVEVIWLEDILVTRSICIVDELLI